MKKEPLETKQNATAPATQKPEKEKAVKPAEKPADAAQKKEKKPLLSIAKLLPKKKEEGKDASEKASPKAPKRERAPKKEKSPSVRLKPRRNPLLVFKHLTFGRKNAVLTTIEVDAHHSAIHFYTMIGGDRSTIARHTRTYAGALFDGDFFKRFKLALREFAAANATDGIRKVTLIIPDAAVLNDVIKIPVIRGIGKTGRNLPHAMQALYSNYSDLRTATYLAYQNRQHVAYAVTAVQKYILSSLYAACSENGMLVDTLTFHSAAAVGGAATLCPKQKNASYLFLDMKDTVSSYAFVANGKVVGTYTLPFGYDFLRKDKITQEDMLFDHATAELAVLNAREKAKSKKLTVMSIDGTASDDEEHDEDELAAESAETMRAADDAALTVTEPAAEEEEADEAAEEAAPAPKPGISPKLYTRRSPRRLPKFMQRPVPETADGILDENFRIFVKWALTLIASNERLTEIAKPEFVCVNLPADLAPAVERVNAELAENGIPFLVLPHREEDGQIAENLSLFGGFFPKHILSGKL